VDSGGPFSSFQSRHSGLYSPIMYRDREELRPFFEPRSVALIGATRKLGFGFGQTRALLSQPFGDRLFLVNANEQELYGRKVYRRVEDIPSPVELAILMVPAGVCPRTLAECAKKGSRAAIVLAAGFAETGEDGLRLQEEMVRVAKAAGIRLIGPNCIGVVNTENGFATSELLEESLRPGHVGVVAQSGVFGNILLDWAPEQGVRFSKVVTIGNRCDVDEADVLLYLAGDAQTKVIAMYTEGFKDARRTLSALKEASGAKPILALKSGRTPAGRLATLSHTGSLSGDDVLYGAAFKQTGVLRFDDVQELFDTANALAAQPRPSGRRIAIITSSGSLGAMTADRCWDLGLEMAAFSEETVRSISALAPPWMNVRNPLDLGPSGLLAQVLPMVLEDPGVDGIIVIFVVPQMVIEQIKRTGVQGDRYLGSIRGLSAMALDKPVLFSTLGNSALRKDLLGALDGRIPLMSSPENAAAAMAALCLLGRR
jgi:acyl-CoA synthetase (NDP forming)